MNRNTNSHFAQVPTINIERSTFPIAQNIRTTFNNGDIIPFFIDLDGLPGDTFKYNFTFVLRLSTPLNPTMDNSYADIYWFKIPHRILWDHFKAFVGENTDAAWVNTTEYEIPMFTTPTGGMQKGTIAEKMGIPQGIANLEFSQLGVRAYCMTYDYWFRDNNLIAPVPKYTDDTARTASNTATELGGKPYKAAKFHDYFTSCLPAPQRGPAVTLPVGTDSAPLSGVLNVYGDGKALGLYTGGTGSAVSIWQEAANPRHLTFAAGIGQNVGTSTSNNTVQTGKIVGVTPDGAYSGMKVNLQGGIADLSSAFAATVNAQRNAYQLQRIYEKDARGGARMKEIVLNHFHTTMPDSRYQIPEYLGGKRVPITISQVLQTSAQSGTSAPLGDTGAFSLTIDSSDMFTTSLTEWSVILGLIVVRADHSYSQGLHKMWQRKRRFDMYWPSLAHLGEQPVYNREIYAQGNTQDNEVFGYQEAWADYRYKPSINTGAFSPNYAQSLDSWHYGDDYNSLPVLSKEWIEEPVEYVDRTLAVQSSLEDQYIMDSLVTIQATRPMPVYSVPGLVDHF